MGRAAFCTASILPAGPPHSSPWTSVTRCCDCLPARLHGVGGEDKVAVNNRSLNCWPGALKASAAKQFKLSPKHPSGGPGTLSWAQRVCLEEIRLVNLSFTEDG